MGTLAENCLRFFSSSFLIWLKYNYLLSHVANEHMLWLLPWGAVSCLWGGHSLELCPAGITGMASTDHHPRACAEGSFTLQPKAVASPGESWGKSLPWERPRLPGVPGGAILGAAPWPLSMRDQDSAGTPLAVTGGQDLSQVPGVQTRDPQPDVGSARTHLIPVAGGTGSEWGVMVEDTPRACSTDTQR